jgi:hypothetical protein
MLSDSWSCPADAGARDPDPRVPRGGDARHRLHQHAVQARAGLVLRGGHRFAGVLVQMPCRRDQVRRAVVPVAH